MKKDSSSGFQKSSPKCPNPLVMLNQGPFQQQKPIFLSIKLIIQNQSKNSTQQMIQHIQINDFLTKHEIPSNRKLILAKLIHELKGTMNFQLQSNFIYFHLDSVQIFMKCGRDPISSDILIRPEDFQKKEFIILKAIDKGFSRSIRLIKFQNQNASIIKKKNQIQDESLDKNQNQQKVEKYVKKKKGGHGNQRKIGYVVECVQKWQKIYKQGNLTLEKAAKKAKIPKKTLDDYFYHLKVGFKWKFNFNEHCDDKIGLLRDFVNRQNLKAKKILQRKKLIQQRRRRRLQQIQQIQLNYEQITKFIQ